MRKNLFRKITLAILLLVICFTGFSASAVKTEKNYEPNNNTTKSVISAGGEGIKAGIKYGMPSQNDVIQSGLKGLENGYIFATTNSK